MPRWSGPLVSVALYLYLPVCFLRHVLEFAATGAHELGILAMLPCACPDRNFDVLAVFFMKIFFLARQSFCLRGCSN